MCTKFYVDWTDPRMKRFSDRAMKSVLLPRFHSKMAVRLQDAGEAVPKQLVMTLAPDKDKNQRVYVMRWGFNLDDELHETYTARTEGIDKDLRYKDDFRTHRCIIPASYFIDRQHRKTNDGSVVIGKEYIIQPSGLDHTYMCGIYRIENGLPCCIILTRAAEGEYAEKMHDRIPLILPDIFIDDWIHPDTNPKDFLSWVITDLVFDEYDLPKEPPNQYNSFL